MSINQLLQTFQSPDDYINEALEFFENYSWIFDTPNQKILCDSVLSRIPLEWLDTDVGVLEEFFNSGISEDVQKLPPSLVRFAEEVTRLKLVVPEFVPSEDVAMVVPKDLTGLSVKKVHEVERLGAFLSNMEKEGTTGIVDVGCGLGYIDRLLERSTNLKLLGIESDEYRTHAATKCSNDAATSRIKYKNLTLDDSGESYLEFGQGLGETFEQTDRLCMLGLHACGDLTVRMFRAFTRCQAAELVVVSCCYHRMANEFPVSKSTKNRLTVKHAFLRLAAQETWVQWRSQDKVKQGWNMFFRACLELFTAEKNMTIVRRRRKPVRTKFSPSLEGFLRFAVEAFDCSGLEEVFIDWAMQKVGVMGAIRVLCVIQARVQDLAEMFIHIDRMLFLSELGLRPSLVKLFDNAISARSVAIICKKTS